MLAAFYVFLGALLAGRVSAFWRLPCNSLLSTQRLDPVVNAGGVSSHVHSISGGSALAPTVNFADLRASQCSSCYVKEDMSLYWTPNLWMSWANGSFSPVPQVGGLLAYYLQRGSGAIKAFPDGFRMLAGTPGLRSYDSGSLAQRAISFVCLDYSRGNGVPQSPKLPTAGCADGLRAQVFFPSCWDGQHLDSDNHKSHVAYPSGMDNGDCPPGYPVRLVSLFYEVTFDTWSLESFRSQAKDPNQPFVFANGDPLGYGFHGDFINGWDNGVLQSAVDTCTDASGVIEKCDKFTFFDRNAQCHKTPSVNEVVTGMLPRLPGCNPVTYGPGTTANCADPSPPSMISNATVYQTKNPPVGAVSPGSPTVQTSGSGYTYAGCYPDTGARTLPNSLTQQATTQNGMTPSTCLAACKAAGYQFCGLEYGQECWAANAIKAGVTPVDDGNCGKVCSGDSMSICGDGSLLTLYKVGGSASTPTTASTTVAASTTPATSPNSLQVSTATVSPSSTAVPTSSVAPAPSSAASINGYTYFGCLLDQGQRTLATSLTSKISGQMTPQACIAAAKAGGWRYAGTEYAQECWAANYLTNTTSPAVMPDSQCNMKCKGDANSFCGGPSRLSAFQLPNWVSPVATNPGPPGSKFLGCYVDSPQARVLRTGKPGGSTAICVQNCAASNFTFAGTEYGGECFCDTQLPSNAALAPPSNDPLQAGCSMPCSQNSTEACGGAARMNVYQMSPTPVAVMGAAAKPKTTTKVSPAPATKTRRAALF